MVNKTKARCRRCYIFGYGYLNTEKNLNGNENFHSALKKNKQCWSLTNRGLIVLCSFGADNIVSLAHTSWDSSAYLLQE